jgi:hypothetical protein
MFDCYACSRLADQRVVDNFDHRSVKTVNFPVPRRSTADSKQTKVVWIPPAVPRVYMYEASSDHLRVATGCPWLSCNQGPFPSTLPAGLFNTQLPNTNTAYSQCCRNIPSPSLVSDIFSVFVTRLTSQFL